ncbi:MAG: hypothetical protein AAF804_09700, partial [Bacteroidota bacterium]
ENHRLLTPASPDESVLGYSQILRKGSVDSPYLVSDRKRINFGSCFKNIHCIKYLNPSPVQIFVLYEFHGWL